MWEVILWRDHLIKQEILSESSIENWVLSQVMQSDKKYKIVKFSQTKKENLSKN